MVIFQKVKYLVLFFSFLYPSLNMSEGFLNSLWQRCTINNAFTAFKIGSQALQLSETAQLKAYTNWDGSSARYCKQTRTASYTVRANIQRIAKELGIQLEDLQIKRMSKAEKCADSLGIEVTRNFIFVHEYLVLLPSKDSDGGKIIKDIEPLFDFSDKYNPVVTFLIRQALLKWKQAFYTKRIVHNIGMNIINSFITSYVHDICINSISNILNPSFNNAWARWGLDQAKFFASKGLFVMLLGLSSYCTDTLKSRRAGSAYYDIIQKAADFHIPFDKPEPTLTYVQEKLMEIQDACIKMKDIRARLIQQQITVLGQIIDAEISEMKTMLRVA